MSTAHVKSGQEVVVLAGNDRGKRGKVMRVIPKKDRVLVEGVNVRKRHEKGTQDNPQGTIAEREVPIHISNVMEAGRYDARQEGKKA